MKYTIIIFIFSSTLFAQDPVLFDPNFDNKKITEYVCGDGGTCAGISYTYKHLYDGINSKKIAFDPEGSAPKNISEARELIKSALNGESVKIGGINDLSELSSKSPFKDAFAQMSGEVQKNYDHYFPKIDWDSYMKPEYNPAGDNLKALKELVENSSKGETTILGWAYYDGDKSQAIDESKYSAHAVLATEAKVTENGYEVTSFDSNNPGNSTTYEFDKNGELQIIMEKGANGEILPKIAKGSPRDYAFFEIETKNFQDVVKSEGYQHYTRSSDMKTAENTAAERDNLFNNFNSGYSEFKNTPTLSNATPKAFPQ